MLSSFMELREKIGKLEVSAGGGSEKNSALKYIKNLRVEAIDICFTFRSSPGHSLTASTKNLIGDFGLTLASIDQAQFKLSQLLMTHIFGSINDIFTKITRHFSQQFVRQLYKLFGSFDLLGNPVSLIENLGHIIHLSSPPTHHQLSFSLLFSQAPASLTCFISHFMLSSKAKEVISLVRKSPLVLSTSFQAVSLVFTRLSTR